ncbi:elongation factor 1-delta-like isoform X2 [Oppia nitens]|uniref:elongation factor 1-delta-like isoform X2 n=1 Tax=Oppia nitens TaxID=1686743 RepID=UPI0023DBDB5D|nr:elongation factor 1-delta-like isoform X2 [Oppia nitens]
MSVDLTALAKESVWTEKYRYADAERDYHSSGGTNSCHAGTDGCNPYADRINSLETENQSLKKSVNQLTALVSKLELRVSSLEKSSSSPPSATAAATAAKPVAKPAATAKAEDNDSDVDLFGSDDDDDDKEADELKKKRLEEYANKKAKKPGVIAKSSVVLDIKPWDDETDMKAMEENVRKIVMDGLVWGASKLVPLAYGIKKLQIVIVIEDDKVSVEELTEKLEELEDYVQSVDIAAFNKI